MKRVLSIILVAILLTLGCGITGLVGAIADVSSNISVQNTPVFYSGKWAYQINKSGYVSLVGYTDKSVTSITVPHEIDGKFVSSLADGAFSDLSNLNTITIPTEINTFGNNLFSSCDVTIRAWNGSLALSYASFSGLKKQNLSELDLQADVVDLSGASRKAYYISENSLIVESTLALTLTKGKPFFIPGTDTVGLNITTGIISSQSSLTDNKFSLSYSAANRSDIIRSLNMSSSDSGVMIEVMSLGEDVEYNGEIGQALNISNKSNKSWDFPFNVKGLKINCNLSLDFDFSADIYAKLAWPPVGAELNRCNLISTLTTTVTGNYSKSFKWDKKLADVRVYKKLAFEVYFQFYLHVQADGTIDVNIKKVDTFGVKWNKSRQAFDKVDQHYTPSNKITINADAYLSIEPAVLLHVIFFGDVAKLSVEVGVKMHATAVIRNITNLAHGQPVPTCIDITAWLEGKVNIKVGKWDDDEVKPKGILWDKTFPFKSGNFIDVHLEDGKAVGKAGQCNRHEVTVKFDTHGGSSVSNLTIEWGSCIRVGNPSRKGYDFTGWFYDASLKKKVDLKQPITQSMTIHAGWAKKNATINNPKDPIKKEYSDTNPSTDNVITPPDTTVFEPVPVTSVELNAEKVTVFTEGEDHTAQLAATVLPLKAKNRALNWSSSDTSVATVDSNGIVTGIKAGTAIITATSSSSPNIKDTCNVTVIQRVTSISLNKTMATIYTSDKDNTIQLMAEALPMNADIRTITWKSSNPEIASIDENGLVYGISPGIVTITAVSNMMPDVTADCTITVLQRARQIYLDDYNITLLRGENRKLTATVWPEDTSNKAVIWSSSDTTIADVDQTGFVTTKKDGVATITASCADGSEQTTSVDIVVEKNLEIQGSIDDQQYYLSDFTHTAIGSLVISPNSIKRIHDQGYDLTWIITQTGDNATEINMKQVDYTITTITGAHQTATAVQIELTNIIHEGHDTVTITANAGPWSDSYTFHTNVSTIENLAEAVTLNRTTFRIQENESITIPNTPIAVDSSQTVPAGTRVELSGSDLYRDGVVFGKTNDGQTITFSNSGYYEISAVYKAGNLSWYVELSIYVEDNEGIVHLPVSAITLSEKTLKMVVGNHAILSSTIAPDDAYNKSISWESGDESIVSVQNGEITAIAAGRTYVKATADDGSGVEEICYVQVEDFLHLSTEAIDVELFMGGQASKLIGGVELTYESTLRLLDKNYTPTWALLHENGSHAADIALVETEFTAPDGIVVSGNGIRLLRINHTGSDTYMLNCSAGPYSASIPVNITVSQDTHLPESVTISQTVYTGTIGDRIELYADPIIGPSVSSLPETTEVSILAPSNFWKAAESRRAEEADFCFVFTKSGIYTASIIFEGSNYQYDVPITFTIMDEDGNVAIMADELTIMPYHINLLTGGTENLSAIFNPTNTADQSVEWSSSDEDIATVSSTGVVTAVGSGKALIRAYNETSGVDGYCTVSIENGMTIDGGNQDITVYVDGNTRTTIKTVYLTEASSIRAGTEPTWRLTRKSGTNLTLKMYPVQTLYGNTEVYGVDIDLYSLSRTGDTVYELSCTDNNGDNASINITVHAVSRDDMLPAVIELAEDTFIGTVNSIIAVDPSVTCWPVDRSLPDDVRVSFEFDDATSSVLNPSDYYVSRSHSTFSFNQAGTYFAILEYSHTNVTFSVPITFKVADESGNVPLFLTDAKIYPASVSFEPGESTQLSVSLLPATATQKNGTWNSMNSGIATVTPEGVVTAVAKGTTQIVWTPVDTHANPAVCSITVEDSFTVLSETTNATLYLQGNQNWRIASWKLSPGTASRLNASGIIPEWSVAKKSGTATQVQPVPSHDGMSLDLRSEQLISGGKDIYTVSVQAGSESWSTDFEFNIIDLGITAPQIITLETSEINGNVGQALTIDFSPITVPSNTSIPDDLLTYSSIYGLGQFYDHLISMVDDGEHMTVVFKDPGTYLAVRNFNDRNLQYNALCTITIAGNGDSYTHSALNISDSDATVYIGGKNATVSHVSFNDGGIPQTYRDEITWSLERVSGNSATVGLISDNNGADIYVANADSEGTDIWRVKCAFGGYEEYQDFTLHVEQPYAALPETAILMKNSFDGIQGSWINIPLAVECSPTGTRLPDIGAEYWSLNMIDGIGAESVETSIIGGVLRVRFTESGYYTGILRYNGGNVTFKFPVYFSIEDEEGEVALPSGLGVFFTNKPNIIFTDGAIDAVIGTTVLSDKLDGYTAGVGYAYANKYSDSWSIETTSGDACTLAIQKSSPGVADLVVTNIVGSGDVTYTVTCFINENSYTTTGTVHVEPSGAAFPDLQLSKSNYIIHVGDTVSISNQIIDQNTHTALLSADDNQWNNTAILTAIGHDFETVDKSWIATFYKTGTFETTVTVTYGNLSWDLPLIFKVLPASEEITLVTFKVPASLTAIDEEAFLGNAIEAIDLRGSNVKSIGDAAFKNCRRLQAVYWNSGIQSIADDAFNGCTDVVFYIPADSAYVIQYAQKHRIQTIYNN